LPTFGQLGLGQIVVFSQYDSLVDAAKLQQARVCQQWGPLWPVDRPLTVPFGR
jgi:hypothetical protein